MKHLTLQYLFLLPGLLLMAALMSCDSEKGEEPNIIISPDDSAETVEVPISITLGSGWDKGDDDISRAAPPGTGGGGNSGGSMHETLDTDNGILDTSDIDEVRIEVFRRKADTDDEFIRDPLNCLVRPLTKGEGATEDKFNDKEEHWVATGKITKVFGYEYKIVAIAYSKKSKSGYRDETGAVKFGMLDGDLNRFGFNFDREDYKGKYSYSDFKAIMAHADEQVVFGKAPWNEFYGDYGTTVHPFSNGILNCYAVDIPQLFYGECYVEAPGGKKDVVSYSENDSQGNENSLLPIKGLLFRGMAKVEIHIKKPTAHKETVTITRRPDWVALLADNVYAEVGLQSYDDFLPGSASMSTRQINTEGKKTAVYTIAGFTAIPESDYNNSKEMVVSSYFLPGKTRLAVRVHYVPETWGDAINCYHNATFTGLNQDWGAGGNGTGIISPDLHDGIFYLRRNHKYVIKVSDLEDYMKTHEMQ